MKSKLLEIVPDNPYSFNISFDEKIGVVGKEVMEHLKNLDKLKVSHTWKGLDYRLAFGTSGGNCLGYFNDNLEDKIWDMFFTHIILPLGLNELNLNELKFETLKSNHYVIGNVDATIICETPKMQPYISQMTTNIANDCMSDLDRVNIKATTTEKLGFIGRSEGIAAQAICLIQTV